MNMLGTEKFLDKTAKASSIRWYDHVLRKDENVIDGDSKGFKIWSVGRTDTGTNQKDTNTDQTSTNLTHFLKYQICTHN